MRKKEDKIEFSGFRQKGETEESKNGLKPFEKSNMPFLGTNKPTRLLKPVRQHYSSVIIISVSQIKTNKENYCSTANFNFF